VAIVRYRSYRIKFASGSVLWRNRRFLRVLVPATSTEEAESCHPIGEAGVAAGDPDGKTTEQQSLSAPSTTAPRRCTRVRKPRVIISASV
jgi:hypothetical protein